MEYSANGTIILSPTSKTRLSSDVSFVSPSKSEIVLSSKSDDVMSVTIKLKADNDTSAHELAQVELDRICNRLSISRNIAVSKRSISGMSCISNLEGQVNVSASITVGVTLTANATVTLGDKTLTKLTSALAQDYSNECEEAISMWREALSNESSALKYFLLYRLLEFLFNNDTRELTNWIINKESQVEIVSDRQRGKVTIYTYLRDHIHPKSKIFPIQQIQENVSKLQTLVQHAIKEKYNIQ